MSDRQIGQNVARARGSMSQQRLADLMRASGWRWSQATVWAIEKGERPLRLAEAADVAIFTGNAEDGALIFLRTPDQAAFDMALANARRTVDHLRFAVEELVASQRELESLSDSGNLLEGSRDEAHHLIKLDAVDEVRRLIHEHSDEAADTGPVIRHVYLTGPDEGAHGEYREAP